ncbi:HAD family hydrolase [Micromonospora sp. AMSO12t]|uniref:HAD family hydrolase n=1 Tax=Micromonospora sp. AMSO12t TaxID=2650410 RepID=UPI001788B2D5|nr:HAD-IA family hydrolase [Micromonospora sp. AMSO12t]
MTMRVKAVLLDLDGTLLDHKGAAEKAFLAACLQWLPDLDEEARYEAHTEWQRLEAVHMRAYLDKTMTFQEQRRARLRGVLSAYGRETGAVSDDQADDLFTLYLRHYENSWAAYSDVPEVMRFLGGAPAGVAVLSNGDRAQQEAKLASLRLPSTPPLFTPSDVSASKPNPTSFLGACERMGWEPSEVLYVGDDLQGDALAAAAAGLRGCWLDRQQTYGAAAPEGILRVHSLFDLATADLFDRSAA